MKKDPRTVSQTDKQAWSPGHRRQGREDQGRRHRDGVGQHRYEWQLLRVVRRLVHRAGDLSRRRRRSTCRRASATSRGRARYPGVPGTGGWEIARGVADCSPTPSGRRPRRSSSARPSRSAQRLTDLILRPSHAMLTIHEVVAHATEIDRVIGYEANYAGTSFVKICGHRQAEVRLEALQHHRRQDAPNGLGDDRLRRRRREDDGVPDRARGHSRRPADESRDRALPPGDKASRGCTYGRLLARLPVPADAERPRRAGPGRTRRRPSRSSPTRRTA